MSKYVKNLVAEHLREQFQGVNEALLVNMVGWTPWPTRGCGQLRKKTSR